MSVKCQRSPVTEIEHGQRRPGSRRRYVLEGQPISLLLVLISIWITAATITSADAAELPRQKIAAKDVHRPLQSENKKCPLTDPGTTPENDRTANIEKLLSDLNASSNRSIDAVPDLISALRRVETHESLRERIAMMLGRIGEPARAAVPELIRLLREFEPKADSSTAESKTSDETCYWVMKSLGLFGVTAADSVQEVRRILVDDQTSPQLRLLAADTLGQIRSPAAIGILIKELMRPRRDHSNDETVLRQVMIDSLAQAGPLATGAVPALSRATGDHNAAIRRKACQALGALGPRAEGGMSSLLERLVLDHDAAVKDAAAEALSQLGQEAIPVLSDLLKRGDSDIQWRSAKSLGQMGTSAKNAIPQLQLQLRNSDDRVRIEAADALLKVSLQPRLVTAALIRELSNDDRQIRRRASQILISIQQLPDGISEQLNALSESDNSNVSHAAAYVIRERIRQQNQ